MKSIGEILKAGLLAIALVMTLGSVFAPLAEAVDCKEDPGDSCKLSSGDTLRDWDEVDKPLETEIQ